MGREPVHYESNMMKLTILTLAAITVVLGAPTPPDAPAVYKLEEASDPRRSLEKVYKFDAEPIKKRSAEDDEFDKIAGFVCPINCLFSILFIHCQKRKRVLHLRVDMETFLLEMRVLTTL